MITKKPLWQPALICAIIAVVYFFTAGYIFGKSEKLNEYVFPVILIVVGSIILFIGYTAAIDIDYDYDSIVEDEIDERVDQKLKQIKEAIRIKEIINN